MKTINIVDINILFIELAKSEFNTNVCYKPPHVKAVDFLEQFVLLATLHREKVDLYFTGDMNFNNNNNNVYLKSNIQKKFNRLYIYKQIKNVNVNV